MIEYTLRISDLWKVVLPAQTSILAIEGIEVRDYQGIPANSVLPEKIKGSHVKNFQTGRK